MPLKTDLEQLEEVQTAISRILARGEETSHENWRMREANLASLQSREKELLQRIKVSDASSRGISRRQNIRFNRG
jgi:FixJ family two-component response regulator